MAVLKKPARQLGLDDLRYDVECTGKQALSATSSRRVGTLLLVDGPWKSTAIDLMGQEFVTLHLAAGPRDTLRIYVPADDEVTVDRAPQRSVHDLPTGRVR